MELALKLLNGLIRGTKSFFNFMAIVLKPLKIAVLLIYRWLILPVYKTSVSLGMMLKRSLGPIKNKYLIPFINRYVTHTLIIGLTVTVVFLNYQVKETRAQSFGEKSILYSLVKGADLSDSLIEEGVEPARTTQSPYMNNLAINPLQLPSVEDTPEINVSSTITQGGGIYGTDIASLDSQIKRNKVLAYEVQSGDSVGSIANKFGLKLNTIYWANNLASNSYIRPGQSLVIPPADGLIYTVKKGDTLAAVSKKYGGDLDKVIEFNRLDSAQDIAIGQQLLIPGGKPYAAPPPITQPKIAKVKDIFNKVTGTPDTSIAGLIWPTVTRRLSQYFTWRHTGLDIDGDFGDPIWASADGVVTRVKYLNYDYGYHVIIDHGNGIQTLYAHFQRIYVTPGQTVTKGQALGEMGSTGRSTGSHLHFEVRVRGSRNNPLNYVSRK